MWVWVGCGFEFHPGGKRKEAWILVEVENGTHTQPTPTFLPLFNLGWPKEPGILQSIG